MSEQAKTDDDVMAADFDLSEPPQKVWRALTEPALVERWLMPEASADLRERESYSGDGGRLGCTLIDAEPGRRVSYAWRDGARHSIVTFSVAEATGGGTRLKVVHSGLATRQAASAVTMSAGLGCRLLLAGPARTRRPENLDIFAPTLRLAA